MPGPLIGYISCNNCNEIGCNTPMNSSTDGHKLKLYITAACGFNVTSVCATKKTVHRWHAKPVISPGSALPNDRPVFHFQ